MATLTINIDNEKDLTVLEEFLMRLGLDYHLESSSEITYSEEFKDLLDKRYNDYLEGKTSMISANESQKRIQQLLAGKNNDV